MSVAMTVASRRFRSIGVRALSERVPTSPRRQLARWVAMACACGAAVAPGSAAAADRTLAISNFAWSNPLAWFPVGEPRAGENVYIDGGTIGYAPSTLFQGDTFASVIVDGVDADWSGNMKWGVTWLEGVVVSPPTQSFAHVLEISGRHLRTHYLGLGVRDPGLQFRSGALFQEGGRIDVSGSAVLGEYLRDAGYFRMTGGGVLAVGGDLVAGNRGQGLVAIDSGTAQVGGSMYVGRGYVGNGILNLLGGSLSVGGNSVIGGGGPLTDFQFQGRTVAVGGLGIVRQRDARHSVVGDLVLGSEFHGFANYETFAGSVIQVGGSVLMGRNEGWGDLLLGGGTATIGLDVIVGVHARPYDAELNSRLTLRGGAQLAVGRDLVVGDAGRGLFELGGNGSTSIAGSLVIGRSAGGIGGMSFLDGSLSVAGHLIVGSASGSQGSLEISAQDLAARFSLAGILVVADAGRGSFIQRATGVAALPGGLIMANSAGSVGSVELLDGGGLHIGSGLVVGGAGVGTLTLNSTGTLSVAGLTVIGQHAGSSGMIRLDAGASSFLGGIVIGGVGRGSLLQNRPGLLAIEGSVVMGQSLDADGGWTMGAGTGAIVFGNVTVGGAGRAQWLMRDSVVLGDIIVGALPNDGSAGHSAVISADGLDAGTRQNLVVGDLGTRAQLSIRSQRFLVAGDAIIGRGTTGQGMIRVDNSLTLSSPSLFEVGGQLVVGDQGRGQVYVPRAPTGILGSIKVDGEAVLGLQAGSDGRIEFDAWGVTSPVVGGMTIAGPLRIGVSGAAVVDLHTGHHSAGGVTLAENAGSVGELDLVGPGSLRIDGDLALTGLGTATVLHAGFTTQQGYVVDVRARPDGSGGNLLMGGASGSRLYTLQDGRLSVENAASIMNGTLRSARGSLTAGHLDVGAGGVVTLFDRLVTDADPGAWVGSALHAAQRVSLRADGRLTLPAFEILAGGLYAGEAGGSLTTDSILMRSGGSVAGVLQNTGVFRYEGGSFVDGAGLRNQGSVDLNAPELVVGFLDNSGSVTVPTGRALSVVRASVPSSWGGGTGMVVNRGSLTNSGAFDGYGLVVEGGASFAHLAGATTIGAGGINLGSPGVAIASMEVGAGNVTVNGPFDLGVDGPGVLTVTGGSSLRVGASAGDRLRIGPQGTATVVDGTLGAASGRLGAVIVDVGGMLTLHRVTLDRIDGLDVQGRLDWQQGNVVVTGGPSRMDIAPTGQFVIDAGLSTGVLDDRWFLNADVLNRGTWRVLGAAGTRLSTLSGHVVQDGQLDIEGGTLRLVSGATGAGTTVVRPGGQMRLESESGVPKEYLWSGGFTNDGSVSVFAGVGSEARAVFSSNGTHRGSFGVNHGGTIAFAGGSQRFVGGSSLTAYMGTIEFLAGSVDFDAGSALQVSTAFLPSPRIRFLGGNVRMNAGSAIDLPETFAIEGTDLDLSTGAVQNYARDIAVSAGALGGSDTFIHHSGRFDWTGGTLYGAGEMVLNSGVTLYLAGTADKRLDRSMRVYGPARWEQGNVGGAGLLSMQPLTTFLGMAAGTFSPNIELRGALLSQVDADVGRYLGRLDAIGGLVQVELGGMQIAGGGSSNASIEVRSDAFIEFAGAGREFVFDGANARLFGAGTARFADGRTVFRNGATFGPLGAERIVGGTLELAAGSHYTFNPELNVASGALLVSTGLGVFHLPSTTTLEGGTLGGSDERVLDPGSALVWTGGTLAGPGALQVSGNSSLRIAGAADKVLDAALSNAGQIVWENGNVLGTGAVANLASGVTEVSAGGRFVPAWTNAGLVRVTNGSATANLQGTFRNDGTLRVENGTLALDGSFANLAAGTLSGGTYFIAGTLRHAGSSISTIAADVTLSGPGASFRNGPNVELLDSFVSIASDARLRVESGRNFVQQVRNLTIDGRFEVGPGSTFEALGANVAGTGTIHVLAGGTMRWTRANLTADGGVLRIDPQGMLLLEDSISNHTHAGRTLINEGTVVWRAGDVAGGTVGANASSITNAGLWSDEHTATASSGASINHGPANPPTLGTFFNSGTYRKSGVGRTRFVNQRLDNSGRIELIAGELDFNAGGVNRGSGQIDIAAGRTLRLAQGSFAFENGSVVSGAGSLRMETATSIDGDASFANLVMASGTVSGSHTLDGRITWHQSLLAANGATTIAPTATLVIADPNSNHEHFGRTIVNHGTVQWTTGDVRGGSGSEIVNAGLWEDQAAASHNAWNNGVGAIPVFSNTGRYVKSGAGTTNFNGYRMENSGRIELLDGVLAFNVGGSSTGVIDIAAGRTVLFQSGAGFSFGAGSRVTGAGVVRFEGGTGARVATLEGATSFSNLLMLGGRVEGTHTLDGRITWHQSLLAANGTTTIAPTATLVIADPNSNHDHFGRAIVNQGAVQWTAGDVRGGSGSAIVNAGLWEDQAAVSHNAWNNGVGATPVFSNTGRYVKSGVGTTNFNGYRMDNSGTIEVQAGTLNFAAGVAQVSGNHLTGGTWIAGPSSLILIPGIASLVVNSGSVHLRGVGSGMSGISTLADNRGEFRISEGRNFTTVGNLVNSGLVFAGAGSRLTVNGTFVSTGTLGGGGELQVGVLSAAGPIVPGSSPGRLLVDGSLVLQESASLEIEVAGPGAGIGYDTLEVTGAATLAGQLQIDVLTTFAGMGTTSFAILAAGSVTGQFAGLPDGARVDARGRGGSFVVDYTPTAVYLMDYVPAPVPEPRSWVLLGVGLCLVSRRVRRMYLAARPGLET